MDEVAVILREFGPWIGSSIIAFFGFHIWIYRLYAGHLSDLRAERDRLAAENLEYRGRFHELIDTMVFARKQQ